MFFATAKSTWPWKQEPSAFCERIGKAAALATQVSETTGEFWRQDPLRVLRSPRGKGKARASSPRSLLPVGEEAAE